MWRANPASADQRERVIFFEEELAGVVEADGAGGVLFLDLFGCAGRRGSSPRPRWPAAELPSRRISGVVSRSGLLFASQPCRPLGPSRPWFTRSVVAAAHADDLAVLHADVQPAAVGAEHAGRLHPAIGGVQGPLVYTLRPLIFTVGRARTPNIAYSICWLACYHTFLPGLPVANAAKHVRPASCF